MKRILALVTLCGMLAGCEPPESTLSLSESIQRKTLCESRGGEYIVYKRGDMKLARTSTCKVSGVEYQFFYGRYTGNAPQL